VTALTAEEMVSMQRDENNPNTTNHGVSVISQWLKTGIILVLIVLAGIFIADQMFNPAKFQITEIEVHGQFLNVDGEQVKRVVESAMTGNYFSISLKKLENQIKNLPWAYSASVRSRWPSTLVVEVVEIQPVAVWSESRWLNFTGDLVAQQQPGKVAQYTQLPKLSGPDSDISLVWQSFRRWSGKFASTGLSLDGLTLDSRGLWYLQLSLGALAMNRSAETVADPASAEQDAASDQADSESNQTDYVSMIVDDTLADERINRFIKTLNQQLIVQFPYMTSIDLRYPNGFAIRWQDDIPPESRVDSDSKFISGESN
jgi:cell division protein FtsQ